MVHMMENYDSYFHILVEELAFHQKWKNQFGEYYLYHQYLKKNLHKLYVHYLFQSLGNINL